jgi:hypothetical protein
MNIPLHISLWCLGIMITSLLLHELGHMIMAWRLGKDSKIVWHLYSFDVEFDATGLSNEEIMSIYLSGIMAGFLPLIGFLALPLPGSTGVVFFLLGGLLHLQTCTYDIGRLGELKGQFTTAILAVGSPIAWFLGSTMVFLLVTLGVRG